MGDRDRDGRGRFPRDPGPLFVIAPDGRFVDFLPPAGVGTGVFIPVYEPPAAPVPPHLAMPTELAPAPAPPAMPIELAPAPAPPAMPIELAPPPATPAIPIELAPAPAPPAMPIELAPVPPAPLAMPIELPALPSAAEIPGAVDSDEEEETSA